VELIILVMGSTLLAAVELNYVVLCCNH
jgi:hypothetical protein